MNPGILDVDVKMNMSLDEIIHLNKDQINSQLIRRGGKKGKKKRKKKKNPDSNEHSVPLLASPGGVGIYVSKKSCLLNAEHRRRITEAFTNRAVNSALIEKSKEIIPAEYKLVRTGCGVERILVPVEQSFERTVEPTTRKLQHPRKLNKQTTTTTTDDSTTKPPPLMSLPIYSPPAPPDSMLMDVDDDNEITILDCPQPVKQCQVIDVESDLPMDVLEVRKLCLTGPSLMPNNGVKTLSDRFTMLTRGFQF